MAPSPERTNSLPLLRRSGQTDPSSETSQTCDSQAHHALQPPHNAIITSASTPFRKEPLSPTLHTPPPREKSFMVSPTSSDASSPYSNPPSEESRANAPTNRPLTTKLATKLLHQEHQATLQRRNHSVSSSIKRVSPFGRRVARNSGASGRLAPATAAVSKTACESTRSVPTHLRARARSSARVVEDALSDISDGKFSDGRSASPPGLPAGRAADFFDVHSEARLTVTKRGSSVDGSARQRAAFVDGVEEGLHHGSQPLPYGKRFKGARQRVGSNEEARGVAGTSGTSGSRSTSTTCSIRGTIKRPVIYFAQFGTAESWAGDVFTLGHNAVRAECVDLYNILESVHARSRQVCLVELEEFYVWWRAFEMFMIECFDFEADVLFPWVFSTPALGRANGAEAMYRLRQALIGRKEGLLDSIRQLNGTFELRRHVDSTDVFETILQEVNEFIPKLLDYFQVQETHLPVVVSQMYTCGSKDMMIKKYVQYIKRGECPQMNLVMVCKWMEDSMRERWIKTYLRGYWRFMHRRLEKRCYRNHGFIASRFHGRLQKCVRNVAASRLRRRTEFGEEIDDISFSSFPSRAGSIRHLHLGGSVKAFYSRGGRDAPLAHLTNRSRGGGGGGIGGAAFA